MDQSAGGGRARRVLRTSALTVALAAATTACGTPGELGNGTFWYECSGASDGDVACLGWGSRREIPHTLAVEATFRLSFDAHQSQVQAGLDEQAIVIEPASWDRAAGGDGSFRLLEPGTHSFIARGDDGTAVDYVHVHGRQATGVELLCDVTNNFDPLKLTVGQTAWLDASPADTQGAELAGRLTYTWLTHDSSIASLEAGVTTRRRGVRGEAAGATEIHVNAGGATRVVPVEVTP